MIRGSQTSSRGLQRHLLEEIMHKKTGETPTRKNRIVRSRQRAAAAATTDRWGSDKTCTTHDVRAVTSAGQNDRRSYRSAVHRGRINTTRDDETIVARARAKPVCSVGLSSVGPTASLRSQEGARPARTTRSFGADSASDDVVGSASDDE